MDLVRWTWRDKFALGIVVAFLVYSVYWSYLTLLRYYALNAAVYDLGLSMQQMWIFTQPGETSALGYLANVLWGPVNFLFSPFALIGSYPLILIFQSLALGAAAIPTYVIAVHELKDRLPSFLVALSYLFYFPLAGSNWFDFHFQVFFIPFFLFGFAFYVKGWYKASYGFLFLAGVVDFPYEILIGMFAFILLFELVLRRLLLHERWNPKRFWFAFLLLAIMVFFFAFQYLDLTYYLGSTAFSSTVHQVGTPVQIDNALTVLLLVVAPVILLPLLSPRWLVMLIPFAYLVLTSGCWCYTYPSLFQLEYGGLYIPFVFLGAIYAISWLTSERPPSSSNATLSHYQTLPRLRRSHYRLKLPLCVTIFVVTMLFATVYQPYGPFNAMDQDNFNVNQSTEVDWSQYQQLHDLAGLIPRSNPYVLFQNNMPELLPRPLSYLQTPLISTILDWKNCSVYDAVHNSFPLLLSGAVPVNARIDYSIDDPLTSYFLGKDQYNSSVTMYCFMRSLYDSGVYGILGEDGGMMVLERNYTGAPQLYVPYSATFTASELDSGSSNVPSGQGVISITNAIDAQAWGGPDTFLSPGRYDVRYTMMTTSSSPLDRVELCTTADNGHFQLGDSSIVTGENFTSVDTWTDIDQVINVNDTYVDVDFAGLSATWNGTLSIQSIQVTQLSPGSPTAGDIFTSAPDSSTT
jgi:uncharacterized membrane protein